MLKDYFLFYDSVEKTLSSGVFHYPLYSNKALQHGWHFCGEAVGKYVVGAHTVSRGREHVPPDFAQEKSCKDENSFWNIEMRPWFDVTEQMFQAGDCLLSVPPWKTVFSNMHT